MTPLSPAAGNYGQLRANQRAAVDLAHRIVSRNTDKKVFTANVTPGGGKTLMASLFADVLVRGGSVDHVCVVCPRDSLRHQVRQGFTDKARGLHMQLAAEKNGKTPNEQKRLFFEHGYVTTYQSIDARPTWHWKKQQSNRWLLILDEPHHMAEDETARWRDAVAPLVEQAKIVLLMSGTLWRHDRKRIPFVEYDERGKPFADISYTRQDALSEKAVLPISATLFDADVDYGHRGARVFTQLCSAEQKEQARTLKTALLDSSYVDPVIHRGMTDLQDYRSRVYPSKGLVVCHTQGEARRVAEYVRGHFRQFDVALAISEDTDSSKRIRAFREDRGGDILVTVGMAYEGLDVPSCTHLVCLTDIRSWPWLDQCFARVTRFDGSPGLPWDKQQAWVYAPNDSRMRDYVANMNQEQLAIMGDKAPRQGKVVHAKSTFEPGNAELTGERFGSEDGLFSSEENQLVSRLCETYPWLKHHPHREKLTLASDLFGSEMT